MTNVHSPLFWSSYLLIGAAVALVDYHIHDQDCRAGAAGECRYWIWIPVRTAFWPLMIVLLVVAVLYGLGIGIWHRLGHPGGHHHHARNEAKAGRPCGACYGDGREKRFKCPKCQGWSFGSTVLDRDDPAHSPLERMCNTPGCAFRWVDTDDPKHFVDEEPYRECTFCKGTGIDTPVIVAGLGICEDPPKKPER